MRRTAFTLIELIVVIAIIAILASIIAPNAFKAVEKAKISGTVGDWKGIKTGVMAYYSDMGSWPTNCNSPTNCASGDLFTGTASAGWDGPYLDKWPTGKWANTNITYTVGTANVFGSGGVSERYITLSNVPSAAAQKIDTAVDGGTTFNFTNGTSRYNSTSLDMMILLSRDGAVS